MSAPSQSWQTICPAQQLAERGEGVRFELQTAHGRMPAFVLRVGGVARAWLNQCSHVGIELDWVPGRFLDEQGEAIICAAHGATYDPVHGACLSGLCRGRGLRAVPCRENNGWIEVCSA